MSVVERRQSAGVASPGWIARPAKHVVLRALERLEDGALDVTLPDGTTRRFGRGEPLAVRIHRDDLFRRIALRGTTGLERRTWRGTGTRTTRPASSSS